MLWWFERGGAHTTLEVLELVDGRFELRVINAEGAEHVEQFSDSRELAQRQQALTELLITHGWSRSGEWLA